LITNITINYYCYYYCFIIYIIK